jgi:hypothetical protein
MEISNKTEVIIPMKKLTRFALTFLLFVIVVFGSLFFLFWGYNAIQLGFNLFLKYLLLLIIPIVIVHEGLHGLFWAIYSPKGIKSVKFGFNLEMLSPYTHCNVPLQKNHYFIGGIAPLVFTGILPAIYAMFTGNGLWLFVSAFCTWSSAGDIISCWYIFKAPVGSLILDHPDTLGYYIINE